MKPLPADFAANARIMKVHELLAHYRIGRPTLSVWTRQCGITRKERAMPRRPIPADFAEIAPTMLKADLRRHYVAGEDVIERWLHESGVSSKPFQIAMPEDFHLYARMTIDEICDALKCSRKMVSKWRRELGINLNRERAKPVRQVHAKKIIRPAAYRQTASAPMPLADASTAGRAADYLKRYFTPVCKSETIGKPKGQYVVGGKGLMSIEDMITLAQAKGFEIDGWAKLSRSTLSNQSGVGA